MRTSSSSNPRSAYVEVLTRKLEMCVNTKDLLDIKCKNGHLLKTYLKRIGMTMFNLFAKNLVKEENSKIYASRKRGRDAKTPAARKLKKLTSN